MNAFEDILTRVDAGEPPTKIAFNYPWVSLNLEDKERLFIEAENRGFSGEPLISALYYLIINQFENRWDGIRIASLKLRYSDIDRIRKDKILGGVDKTLDDLRRGIKEDNQDEIHRYQYYKAEILVLKAITALEFDELTEAIKNYRDALALYRECGPKEQIIKLTEIIKELEAIQKNQDHLVPIEQFESERLRLHQEIAELSPQKKKVSDEGKRLIIVSNDLKAAEADLKKRGDKLQEEENIWLINQTQIKTEITEKENQRKILEDGIKSLTLKHQELIELSKEIQNNSTLNENLAKQFSEFNNNIEIAQSKLVDLQSKINEKQTELKNIKRVVKDAQYGLEQAHDSLDQLHKEISAQRDILDEISKEKKEQRGEQLSSDEVIHLREEVEVLKNRLGEYENLILPEWITPMAKEE